MLLYIHVPFCRAKCRYCAFYSIPLPGEDALRRYTDTIFQEISLWKERLGSLPVESIFFGGGTPSLLPPSFLRGIMNHIRASCTIAPGAEISMEANPESFLAIGYAHEIARMGFTRVSLGVQSTQSASLAFLGRPHTAREAQMALEMAREAGIGSVNLDMIWALPGQRRHEWLADLATAISWQPDHLSCYGLSLEEGTPLHQAAENGECTLPDEQEQAAMYMDGAELLESSGYLHYEVSNFARMGFQCQHNLGYWDNQEYLGLGPGATSTIKGKRWTNPRDIAAWRASVARKLPIHEPELLSRETRLKETVMLRLRTTRGLHLASWHALTGRDFMQDNRQLLQMLHQRKLVRIRNGYVSLTRNGMLVSNAILEHLFDALTAQLASGVTP